jgi:hypothetical protein
MDGIVLGSVSEQKNVENFNLRTNHISEEGFIKHITEEVQNAEIISQTEYLTFKKIDSYYFAERKNVDSIAFVLFATNVDDERRVGLTYEYQPGINKSIIKAFTSSIKDPNVDDVLDLVIQEIEYQAGFITTKPEIEYLGKCFVSSNMSEFCHLFGVAVDKTRQFKKEPSSLRKINAGHYWATNEEVKDLEDWRAQTILMKRYLNKKSQILIKKK